jgi:TonB-linked SusC/RagA family outer membrane protein
MTRILSLFVVFMLSGVLAFAQNRVVTGTVKDETGVAVSGATIYVGNKAVGFTDKNGNYSIKNVAPNAIITVGGGNSNLIEKKINSGASGVVDFSVVRTTAELSTVTVTAVTTALGIRKQPKELGYAQTTLNNRAITAGKSADVAQSLVGKVSGLNITSTNSGVFNDTKINFRGIRSLTGNNSPMLVVDGASTPLGYLSSIAPEDILSTTLLKSASAAAIYGPDAINGVIIINTKRGGTADKLTVSLTSSVQFTKVAFFPRLQHQFGPGAGEIINPDGSYGYVPYENQNYGPAFDGTIKEIGVRLEDGSIQSGPYSNLHANDKKNFYNTGVTIQNTISLSGKDFFVSADDAIIHGVVPDDQNRRTSFRFNGGKQYNKFSANYSLNYVVGNFNVVDEGGQQNYTTTSYNGGLFFQVLQIGDNVPLSQYKDWRNNKFAQYSNYYNEFALNPYWIVGNHRAIGHSDDFFGNLDLGYQIKPWLKANARFNTRVLNQLQQNNTAPVVVTDYAASHRSATTYSNKPGSVFNDAFNSSRINFDGFFDGSTAINKSLNVKYVAGGTIRQSRQRDVAAGGRNLVVPYLFNTSVRSGDANLAGAGNNRVINSSLYSLYGSLGFGFKDFAFVEFTGRNDWDSRLVKDNRSFFYPGVNASVVLIDRTAGILKTGQDGIFSSAKLRGAYSKSGNVNINPYSLQPTYSQPAGFPYGNNVGFTTGNTIPSSSLTPEFVYSTEAGIDVGLLKDRITFSASYFNQECKDQILTVSQPSSTGYPFALANAAQFKNYGVEFDLGLTPLVSIGKAKINLLVNATYNDSKVQKTFQDLPVTIGSSATFIQNSASSPTANNQAVVGLPAFVFQLTDYARDPATGKVIVDANTGYPTQASSLAVMGRTLPKWIIGVTPSVSIGNVTVSATLDYKCGHNFYSGLGSDLDFSGLSARSAQYNRQNFVFPNSVYADGSGKYVPNTNILTQDGNYEFWTGANTNTGIATNYFASANALRVREVNLSYSLPASVFANSKSIKRLTFSIVGRNLFLFTDKSNQWGDPEFNSATGANSFGLGSSFQSPSSRQLGLSVNAQF